MPKKNYAQHCKRQIVICRDISFICLQTRFLCPAKLQQFFSTFYLPKIVGRWQKLISSKLASCDYRKIVQLLLTCNTFAKEMHFHIRQYSCTQNFDYIYLNDYTLMYPMLEILQIGNVVVSCSCDILKRRRVLTSGISSLNLIKFRIYCLSFHV